MKGGRQLRSVSVGEAGVKRPVGRDDVRDQRQAGAMNGGQVARWW